MAWPGSAGCRAAPGLPGRATPGHKFWVFLSAIYWSFICFLIVCAHYVHENYSVKRDEGFQTEKEEKLRLHPPGAPGLAGSRRCPNHHFAALRGFCVHFFSLITRAEPFPKAGVTNGPESPNRHLPHWETMTRSTQNIL